MRRRGGSFSGAGGACEPDLADDDRSPHPPPVLGGWSCRCLRLSPLVPRGYAEATSARRNQWVVSGIDQTRATIAALDGRLEEMSRR